MNIENTPIAIQKKSFVDFDTLLDNACARLQHKQAQYSIRRLKEMSAILASLEKELDMLMKSKF